jgi:hypothetical protein
MWVNPPNQDRTGQRLSRANAYIQQVLNKNKTLIVVAYIIHNQVFYEFIAAKNRQNKYHTYFPVIWSKSYTIGDNLPKNIAAEIQSEVLKATQAYNAQQTV